jgi:hypothetical protein
MAADVGRMGDLTTHRLPDMGRLPDMDCQKTRPRPEALPDTRPRRDTDLPLHPYPARSDRRLRPHQGARCQAARAERKMKKTDPLVTLAGFLLLAYLVLTAAETFAFTFIW